MTFTCNNIRLCHTKYDCVHNIPDERPVMDVSSLPEALIDASAPHGHSVDEVLEHFSEKYPTIDYHGRELFLFGQGREFGDRRHIVGFHSRMHPAIPEHIYSYVLISYCYSGTFRMHVDGNPVTLEAGDCIVMDRHVPHANDPTDENTFAVNLTFAEEFFEGRLLDGMANLASPFATRLISRGKAHDSWRAYPTSHDEFVRTCIDRILCEHLEPDTTSPYLVDFFLAALLTHLLRTYEPKDPMEDELWERAELMGTVRQYISQHYREGNLQQMARDLGYERTYLSKFVSKTTGSTFKQLVNQERMRRAAVLLRGTNQPIYEIAEEIGLVNLTSFYQRFREYAGCTPQDYRNQGK